MLTSLFENPQVGALYIVALIICLTLHEFAHAWAAKVQGDDTAERLGRLSLNPLRHLDPVGTVLLLLAGFGWGKPVPFDPYNLKNKKYGPSLVSAAGPASNFLFALFSAAFLFILVKYAQLSGDNLLAIFLIILVQMNLVLGIFNLIPVPPLDGSGIFLPFLRAPMWQPIKFFLYSQGPIVLLILVLIDSLTGGTILGALIGAPIRFFMSIFLDILS